ncbi:MAG: F0F1 ATP synthase subunit epsilon [Ignavibacteriaceae bacterium]|nr:F0F1 ATP synthase subunit epsilon [Ignavibacteriaceae bacterium]
MSGLFLEILTPSKSAFKGEISSITVPGSKGSFQVLVNHAPIVSTLEVGHIKVELNDKTTQDYATGGGTIEVNNNKILLLADSIEKVEEIDVERARQAKERAEERLSRRNIDKEIDAKRAELALARAINRLKLKEK